MNDLQDDRAVCSRHQIDIALDRKAWHRDAESGLDSRVARDCALAETIRQHQHSPHGRLPSRTSNPAHSDPRSVHEVRTAPSPQSSGVSSSRERWHPLRNARNEQSAGHGHARPNHAHYWGDLGVILGNASRMLLISFARSEGVCFMAGELCCAPIARLPYCGA